jgi:para-aminobenzoate synthetase/4-amino-4-deoxychorismate lyase
MVPPMLVAAAALALLFHVGDFAARRQFPVASNHTTAREGREAEQSNETHVPSIGAPCDVAQSLAKIFLHFSIDIRLIGCRGDNRQVDFGEPRAVVQLAGGEWLVLEHPARRLEARAAGDVVSVLSDVERLAAQGQHVAGFLSYEAGAAFGLPGRPGAGQDLPLAWFGVFDPSAARIVKRLDADGDYEAGRLTPSLGRTAFGAAFDTVKQHLADGNSYQANFTFRLEGPFHGDPWPFFVHLVHAQRGRHSCFLDIGTHAICSASPELFFSRDATRINARPMKGTIARGRTLAEDRARGSALRDSVKERAENVMIVDMIRNDLGRIAEVGSVEVPELFAIERYPNVWQMTSLVTARTSASLAEIFAALHPSASVTGAPKRRTMEILRELEDAPRGIYTGAVGHVWPGGRASFNVAIRTAVVDRRRSKVTFGVGSAIVWDSSACGEYDECLLKGSVLGRPAADFELLETTVWRPGCGFLLLDRHLRRLRDSAEYFDFPCDLATVRSALENAVAGAHDALRIRFRVSSTGEVHVDRQILEPDTRSRLRVGLAAAPIDDTNVFLFHKTTRRSVYDDARLPGLDEVILWNARREVTEALTGNIVVECPDGRRITPPVASGLLPGTMRDELLAAGWMQEAVVGIDDLRTASHLWLINSVHDRREMILCER